VIWRIGLIDINLNNDLKKILKKYRDLKNLKSFTNNTKQAI